MEGSDRSFELKNLIYLLVESLALSQPVVLLFKDAHFIDFDSLDGKKKER